MWLGHRQQVAFAAKEIGGTGRGLRLSAGGSEIVERRNRFVQVGADLGHGACEELGDKVEEEPGLLRKPQRQGLVSRPRAAEGTESDGDRPLACSFASIILLEPRELGKAGISPISQMEGLRLKTEVALPQVTE